MSPPFYFDMLQRGYVHPLTDPFYRGPTPPNTKNNSKRLALVIGNSLYGAFSELKNTKKDAADVKAKLESLGFAVENDLLVDRTHHEMLDDVSKFSNCIHSGVTDIVIYYAGHGCSIQGENFLVPINGHSPEDPFTAKQTYIQLDWIIGLMAIKRPQDVPIIFIVDCCRTEITSGQPMHGDPIKTTSALSNVCIMYATANGHIAMDGGEGRNGAFTERLLEYLDTDMTIEEISKMIAKGLKGNQTHWISSSMKDHYRFRQLPKEQTGIFENPKKIKVPFRKNNHFTGRADVLKEMEQNLHHNQLTNDCLPLMLSGLGGMGKTQLMLHYYYTHRNEYKDVFWLNAEGTVAVADGFRLLAEALNIKVEGIEKGDLDGILADRIRECLEARKERWLLMLDNVETISDVSRFIPNMGGDVIVTTRDHVDRRWGSVIHVDKMSRDDALRLLAGPEKHNTPSDPALKIVEELGCMPLAIDIVRAYVDRTDTPLKTYLDMYKKESALLLENSQDSNSNQYKNTIAVVWNLSFEKIRDQNKLAERILGICSILQPDTIPISLFENQSTTLSLDASFNDIHDAIGVLVQFSFVKRAVRHDIYSNVNKNDGDSGNDGKDIIIIHRLVQAVVRDIRMERKNLWKIYERLIAAFDKEIVFGDDNYPQAQRMFAVYVPHIRETIRLADWRQMDIKSQSLLGKLISRTVGHYVEFGEGYQSLHSLANIGLLISEESNGPDHRDTANSLHNLAVFYKNQAKYNDSEPLHQRALAIREKVLGPDHPETASSHNNLARLYYDQGKYDLALPLYQRALAIREKALGPDHPETAQSLNDLANLYYSQGKYGLAEPLYQRSLAIREKALGPDHPKTADSLNNLANLYSDQGKYDLAEPLCRRASAIYERALGPDHPRMAMSLHNLAMIYRSQSEYNKALLQLQKSLKIYEKALGPDHPCTALTLHGLAFCYDKQGKYDSAEPLYQRSLAVFEKALGSDHPETAKVLGNLALLHNRQGKHDKA